MTSAAPPSPSRTPSPCCWSTASSPPGSAAGSRTTPRSGCIALDPTDGKGGLGGLPVKSKVINEREFNDPGTGDLTPYDAIFVCDVKQLTPAEAKRVETHLRSGGGVVFSVGDNVDVAAYNDVLYRNGACLLPARLVGKQTAPKDWFFNFGVEGKAYTLPPLAASTEDDDRVRC
jgi:hypothetical protein